MHYYELYYTDSTFPNDNKIVYECVRATMHEHVCNRACDRACPLPMSVYLHTYISNFKYNILQSSIIRVNVLLKKHTTCIRKWSVKKHTARIAGLMYIKYLLLDKYDIN